SRRAPAPRRWPPPRSRQSGAGSPPGGCIPVAQEWPVGVPFWQSQSSRTHLQTMQHPTTVIRAGRLIDGKSTAVQQDRAVFVEDGTITRVAAGAEIPPGADNIVDLSDATVLPCLIDCHVHLVFSCSDHPLSDLLVEDDQQILLRAVAGARQALSAGITTLRDLGDRGGVTFRLRDAIAKGIIAGSRIVAAGSPITITG